MLLPARLTQPRPRQRCRLLFTGRDHHRLFRTRGGAAAAIAAFGKAEEIVANLRRVDVLMAQGRQVSDAVRATGVTEVTYYRWRNEYRGLKGDQVKRLKELETENSRLRRAVPPRISSIQVS